MAISKISIYLAMILVGATMTINNAKASCNDLLKESGLSIGALPYDKFRTSDFEAALKETLKQSYDRIDAIRQNKDEPTFENTIEAIEAIDEPMEQVWTIFDNYISLVTTPELDQLAERMSPERTRLGNAYLLDKNIFAKVEHVYLNRRDLKLSTEQATLLERTYLAFVRNGAKLGRTEKERVREIDERISYLSEKFRSNVTAAINEYQLVISDANRLKGLPEHAVKAAEALAQKKDLSGAWVFSLQFPSFIAVMTYAEDRALREGLWRAYHSKAQGGANDNRPVLLEMAKLHEERARILGYENHAAYTVEDRMAKSVSTVQQFLNKLADAYRPAAERDIEELTKFAGHEIKPWDTAFYSEKLREKLYGYSEEELRPYFPLDQVIKGAFYVANRLYGITFVQRFDLPVWDKSVLVYEVRESDNSGNENTIALFYLDPFPRESKRQGAWMSELQRAGKRDGKKYIPHVLNAGNFTPPIETETEKVPALLTLDEVYTVFHELGHGLHGMLTRAEYRSLSGAATAWDAVELPSQINENWVIRPEVLDIYARHYKTGDRISDEMIEKIRKAQNFQAGWTGLRQVTFGILDLAWYAKDLAPLRSAEEVEAWEKNAVKKLQIIEAPDGAAMSPAFSHIFGGGYAAGYYSYKWADVLAADAFSVFEKNGIFDQETAKRFRHEFLEKGRTEEPDVLYRRFRGGDPDPDALLRKEGLLK